MKRVCFLLLLLFLIPSKSFCQSNFSVIYYIDYRNESATIYINNIRAGSIPGNIRGRQVLEHKIFSEGEIFIEGVKSIDNEKHVVPVIKTSIENNDTIYISVGTVFTILPKETGEKALLLKNVNIHRNSENINYPYNRIVRTETQ